MRYDYKCNECNKVFEVSHGMMESPDIKCPDCTNDAIKLIHAVPFKPSPGMYCY